jgi:phosphopantetheinyl transferase (holo-ACP synthase)
MRSESRMVYVGNDIVDLTEEALLSALRHPRHAQRILAPEEAAGFTAAADPGLYLARAWAAKEACFKLARQMDASARFLPQRFVFDAERGRVAHPGGEVDVAFRGDESYLYASCLVGDSRAIGHEVARRDAVLAADGGGESGGADDDGRAVRLLARRLVAPMFALAPSDVAVVKDVAGVPFAHAHGRQLPLALSFTHHGAFVGVAFARWADDA